MGRHERRASLSAFKRAADGGYLDVFMLPVDGAITDPLHQRAIAFWRANIGSRLPKCLSCRAEFAGDARVGAYLLAVPSGAPSTASVTGLCAACWSRLTDDEVQRAALRAVRRVLPGAQFEGPPR